MSFNAPVFACTFSPDGKYFAVSHNNGVQVWETPSLLVREFAPFVLHGTYTGHQGEVVGITWSKTGRWVYHYVPLKGVWVADRQILLDNFARHDGENVYAGPG
jgi:WD40 repeat protein